MAVEWWWWPSLPAWLSSEATWFLVLNAVVAAIAVLSSRARPSSASPLSGGGRVTRRASSVLLQRLRSFAIFSSYPSACFDASTLLQPTDAGAQAIEEEPVTPPTTMPSPGELVVTPQPAPAAEDEEEEYLSGMSMEDAYALVLASRRPPEPEREDQDEARRSDVDAKEKEDLRQQRLNSIFNYTQMLKQRALAGGRRQPDARREQL